jgi:hypothetical protein
MANIQTTTARTVARPLKTLIPLIQSELQLGKEAGLEHYRAAGEMLIESRPQTGNFATWVKRNFDISKTTAYLYMSWAREPSDAVGQYGSIRDYAGATDRERKTRDSPQQRAFKKAMRGADDFKQDRQSRNNEIRLHRELAEQLIDTGYRAMATRLHPDVRGGSKDAMARLNRVRDELKSIAQSRRFI